MSIKRKRNKVKIENEEAFIQWLRWLDFEYRLRYRRRCDARGERVDWGVGYYEFLMELE